MKNKRLGIAKVDIEKGQTIQIKVIEDNILFPKGRLASKEINFDGDVSIDDLMKIHTAEGGKKHGRSNRETN